MVCEDGGTLRRVTTRQTARDGTIMFTFRLVLWRWTVAGRPRRDPKVEALRETRTLNPRSDAVTDEAFASSEFLDARDLVQVKYEMVRRVRVDGAPVTRAATAFGFSRPSYYQAADALARDGLSGLVPAKPGPRRGHKLTEQIIEFARAARDADPSLRSTDLASLIAERFGVRVHPRTVERALARTRQPKSGGRP
jgi:transposase